MRTQLQLLDSMGNYKSVCNSARASFNRTADTFTDKANEKLVKYLATHNHWTPFCSLQASIHAELPLAIHAQLVKHQVGGTINTMSRRYVREDVEFFDVTGEWRDAPAENIKQGSGDLTPHQDYANQIYGKAVTDAHLAYDRLLDLGICAEQARFVLPVAQMTKCVIVGSAVYFARIYKQRIDSDAQKEWTTFCEQLDKICSELWPVAWPYLISNTKSDVVT